MGTDPIPAKARTDEFNLKKIPLGRKWKRNKSRPKQAKKGKRNANNKNWKNDLQDMTLADARLWFRYRCQNMDNIKGTDHPNGKTECTADTAGKHDQ